MKTISSFLFFLFITVLLLGSIMVTILGTAYVIKIEIKELTGIDAVGKAIERIRRRHENIQR